MAQVPDDLPRLPMRRRVLILLLAVATGLCVVLLLLNRPGDPKRDAILAAREAAARAAGVPASAVPASAVGGKADVVLLPSGASGPR